MPTYSNQANMELVYGSSNICGWADLDNDQDMSKILLRITWSLETVYSLLNDRLREGPYTLPFIASPSSPTVIEYLSSLWAGVLLYNSRRIAQDETDNQASAQMKEVDKLISDLLSGRMKLDLTFTSNNFPEIPS